MNHIKQITTTNNGGNLTADLIELSDGRVIGITDESATLYADADDFHAEPTTHRQTIDLITPTALTDDERDAYLHAAHQMRQHGGGFAAALAEAYMRADSNNSQILRTAFAHIFNRYAPPPEPPTFAILRDWSGREVDRIMLTDSDPLDCDHYAAIFSNNLGYELEGETEGRIPDGTEDYSITITDDPEGVRCWSSASYMLKVE